MGVGRGSARDWNLVTFPVRRAEGLSGFLPVQSVYADIYVVDDYWPDFTPRHVYDAIAWYGEQDITLGG